MAKAHSMLGYIQKDRGNLVQAAQHLRRALELDPSIADAHYMLANIAAAEGNADASIAGYLRALELDADLPFAYRDLSLAYFEQGQATEAKAIVERGIALFPDFPDLHLYYGNIQSHLNQFEQAVASFHQALACQGESAGLYYNCGIALQALNRIEEALQSFIQAQKLAPDMVDAHFHESICRLLSGDLEHGWRKFEWRWRTEAMRHSVFKFPQQQWTGEQSLAGKTLLLAAEQGYGDTIQFARYARLAAAQGAQVLMMVHEPLAALLQNVEGVSRLLTNRDKLPAFDYFCPMLSLPLAFKTTLESIPSEPAYLQGNTDLESAWKERLGQGKHTKKIGIAWSGNPDHANDKNRSIALDRLLPLLQSEIDFIVLQKNISELDQTLLADHGNIAHYGEHMHDFADTAALIPHLDLVISVDTSIAHLAAAMGKPVWLLLPFSPDWRWMLNRSDSPWYPSMRLFRQPATGDWDSVLSAVKQEILS